MLQSRAIFIVDIVVTCNEYVSHYSFNKEPFLLLEVNFSI